MLDENLVLLEKQSKAPERIYWIRNEEPPYGEVQRTHWLLYNKALEYITEKDVIFDVGCGSGFGTYMIGQKANRVWGLDISQDAISFAMSYNKINSKNNIHFVQADYKNSIFEPNSFDKIICIEFLEHLEDPKSAIDFLMKLVKKDGLLIASSPFDEKIDEDDKFHKFAFNENTLPNVFGEYDYKTEKIDWDWEGSSYFTVVKNITK